MLPGTVRRSFAGFLGVALWIVYVSTASAHAHLISAQPAADVTISSALKELRLTFSESLSKPSSATVVAEAKQDTPIGSSTLVPDNDKAIVVSFPQPLGAGQYTVTWHALAKDGHTTHGSYSFTVQQ